MQTSDSLNWTRPVLGKWVSRSLALLLPVLAGCLAEQSLTLPASQSRRVQPSADVPAAPPSTRAWLRAAHAQLIDLLPPDDPPVLLTEDLATAENRPRDVFAHFDLDPDALHTVIGNYSGLRCTAQGASQDMTVDAPPPPWSGFDDVWIEMADGVRLAARLGFAKDGDRRRDADCIVILPGFFGDNGVVRTRDLARFLLDSGFHVLALEMRGHGQTERTQPEASYTFGVRETDDLLQVSDWLQDQQGVRRTGLIGFCWSANVALLVAWNTNRPTGDPSITPAIATQLYARPDPRRYTAGIMAFSPILQWERLVDELETPFSLLGHPVYATLQKTNRERLERKGHPAPSGSLHDLIEFEYQRTGVDLPEGTREGYLFLRLAPYANRPTHPKLDRARAPILVVHACNDPLSPAQDIADFFARERNPLLAGMILPGGGHVGFATYARGYYFSLIASFLTRAAGQPLRSVMRATRRSAVSSWLRDRSIIPVAMPRTSNPW
jgi:predicted alpha/beta-fold hydrolase